MKTERILFVCLGNICRSPLAEGIFRHHVQSRGLEDRYIIDSAGTGSWHIGHPPDERSVEIGLKNGIDIRQQRARRISLADIYEFDQVIAMDYSNKNNLIDFGFPKVRLLREFGQNEQDLEVPDPYYGGVDGFDKIFKMIYRCCDGLLNLLESNAHKNEINT
jgi:protein-tyrosine phosphatase